MQEVEKIQIDDKVELVYQFVGEENHEKPLVIFLHEGLGSIAQWKKFPENFCEKIGLPGLVYERYGYGRSTPLLEKREPNYLHREAEYFLPILLEKLGLHKRELILIGHSDGASIALIYAGAFPHNIVAVVSMAAHLFVEQISVDSINAIKKVYKEGRGFKKSLERYHFDHTDSTFYAFADTITSDDFWDWNIEEYLSRIEAPVFAVQGVNDEYGTKEQIDSIVNNVPNPKSQEWMIEDCGHSPHLEMEQQVADRIELFLNEGLD